MRHQRMHWALISYTVRRVMTTIEDFHSVPPPAGLRLSAVCRAGASTQASCIASGVLIETSKDVWRIISASKTES